MANPSKKTGTEWETTVVEFLNQDLDGPDGETAAKRTGSAALGAADIHMGDWTIECKAEQAIDLPGYLAQLKASVGRTGRAGYKAVVMVKNRRHSVEDGYAVMSISGYRELMDYTFILEALTQRVFDAVTGDGEAVAGE
jgi:hypothetical protein